MTALWHHMMHPHGWWWILDLLVFGGTGTAVIAIGDDGNGQ